MKEIAELVEELKRVVAQDKDIAELIADFNELSRSFGGPTKSGIHRSSSISKAFDGGNKVVNIPEELEMYKDFIQCSDNYKWVKWQLDGQPFIDISDNCPYCVNEIKEEKDTIRKVSEVYKSKSIEDLNKIVAVFDRLKKYFVSDTSAAIDAFIKNIDGYSEDQAAFLREVKDQVDRLNQKFDDAQRIGFWSLKDVDRLIEGLKHFKIDIDLYQHLKSDSTIEKVKTVNSSIDKLLEKAGLLQGGINRQKAYIEKLVRVNSAEINEFLRNAGFNYKVDIIGDKSGEYKLKLLHNDLSDEVSDVKTHLSFGERNAFSLVLFMFAVLKDPPNLIILDDPISSFDNNKKYAVTEMLFRKEKSFRGKTVLMFTHDFEPIVDMVFHHPDKFQKPFAVFIENTRGRLVEKEIAKADIKTFIEINEINISQEIHLINKLVYLRRLYEVKNIKGQAYQLISNLVHKRSVPVVFENEQQRDMTDEELSTGSEEIQRYLADFDYSTALSIIDDDNQLIELYESDLSNYEKLHIYRLIFEGREDLIDSSVIQKFINQAFHVENDYIYQIDPRKYQTVPQYVIDECDQGISELKTRN